MEELLNGFKADQNQDHFAPEKRQRNLIRMVIPVKAFVKSYLQETFKTKEVVLTSESYIGKYFYMLLKDGAGSRGQKANYKSSITIHITEEVLVRKGFLLDDNGIVSFNNFVEDIIRERLADKIDEYLEPGKLQIQEAILKAMKKMRIDESEYKFDAIKKYYYRKRKSSGNEKG